MTPAVTGEVDLDRVQMQERSGAHAGAFDAPGIALRWDPARARFGTAAGRVCVSLGRPRFADPELAALAQHNTADAWLAAHARHGNDAPQQARGAYAVAIVAADRHNALLAVDRFAMQTLCYAIDGSVLRFSDRADAVAPADASIDVQGLLDYLYFHVIPAPRTIFRRVLRLDAAHALVVTGRDAQAARHWTPQFVEDTMADVGALREQFLELLRAAVEREIVPGRTGAFLSGGTDSSTIAGLIGRITGDPPRTYSIGFDAAGYDEMAYARIAARHFGADHHEYYVTADDLVGSIPAVAAQHDQPFGNSSAAPAYYCARLAHDDGVARMLAGDGGDEVFGGNSRYATQRMFDAYRHVPRAVRAAVLEPWLADSRFARLVPGLRQLAGYVRHARVPMPDRLQAFNLLSRLGAEQILEARLAAKVDCAAPLAQQQAFYRATGARTLINRMLALDWKYTLADSDLPKVRGATQMAGVDVAFPLLDDDLVDFALHLHPELKLKRLKLRYFFKEALRDFLPGEIIAKKKHGFGLPFGVWVTRHAKLRALAQDALDGSVERGITSRRFATELMERHVPSQPSYYGEMVWVLMILELWLRAHRPATRLA